MEAPTLAAGWLARHMLPSSTAPSDLRGDLAIARTAIGWFVFSLGLAATLALVGANSWGTAGAAVGGSLALLTVALLVAGRLTGRSARAAIFVAAGAGPGNRQGS